MISRTKSEAKLQKEVIAYIESRGGLVKVLQGDKGQADLVVCYKGQYIELEIKAESTYYTATYLQSVKLAKVKKAGGVITVPKRIEDVKVILDTVDIVRDT